MKNFERVYHLFFYKIFKGAYKIDEFFSGSLNIKVDLWWNLWKSIILLSILQFVLLLGILDLTEFITSTKIIPKDKSFPLIAGGAFLIIDVFTFIYNSRWKKYIAEFNTYSIKKNRWINFIVIFIIFFILFGYIVYVAYS